MCCSQCEPMSAELVAAPCSKYGSGVANFQLGLSPSRHPCLFFLKWVFAACFGQATHCPRSTARCTTASARPSTPRLCVCAIARSARTASPLRGELPELTSEKGGMLQDVGPRTIQARLLQQNRGSTGGETALSLDKWAKSLGGKLAPEMGGTLRRVHRRAVLRGYAGSSALQVQTRWL